MLFFIAIQFIIAVALLWLVLNILDLQHYPVGKKILWMLFLIPALTLDMSLIIATLLIPWVQ